MIFHTLNTSWPPNNFIIAILLQSISTDLILSVPTKRCTITITKFDSVPIEKIW